MSLDEIDWDLVVVVEEEHEVAPAEAQAGVSRRALPGAIARHNDQWKIVERGPVGATTLSVGLIDHQDLERLDRLVAELVEQDVQPRIAVDGRYQDADRGCRAA